MLIICFFGKITDYNHKNNKYEITLNGGDIGWFDKDEIRTYGAKMCETPNKEIEKLEEELRRKDSELRGLKDLIVKLVYDFYGH